jgi:hypothetical protein
VRGSAVKHSQWGLRYLTRSSLERLDCAGQELWRATVSVILRK